MVKILKTLHYVLILVISIRTSIKSNFNGTNFFHMNISSLGHNFDDLQTLLVSYHFS